MILRCIINPTGITSETYLLKVFENGQYEVTYGIKSSSWEKDDFDSVVRQQSVILKESELKDIKDLQSKVLKRKDIEKTYTKKGGWEVILATKQKKFHFYYGELNKTSIGKLLEKLIQFAPFQIDMHSWS